MGLTQDQKEVLRFSEGAYRVLNDISPTKSLHYASVFPTVGRGNLSYKFIKEGKNGEVRKVSQVREYSNDDRKKAGGSAAPWSVFEAHGEATSLRLRTTIQIIDNVDTRVCLYEKKLADVKNDFELVLNFLKLVQEYGFKKRDYWTSFCRDFGVDPKRIEKAMDTELYKPLKLFLSKVGRYNKHEVNYLRATKGNWANPTTLNIRFNENTSHLRGLVEKHIDDLERILSI